MRALWCLGSEVKGQSTNLVGTDRDQMSFGESRVTVRTAAVAAGVVGAAAGVWYLWDKRNHRKDKDENGVWYRFAKKDDLSQLVQFPIAEGWNPGCEFLEGSLFDLIEPDSLIVGDFNGEIVSCIVGLKHGEKYGWIGLYICKKELRGKNIGYTTWKKCLDVCLKGVDCLGLDGVPARQDTYRKSGFGIKTWNSVRYRGIIKDLASGMIENLFIYL
jgi:hypothetical protein